MTTELEQARAHLLDRQQKLAEARRIITLSPRNAWTPAASLRHFEDSFLAALSWVWDAQERADPTVRMGIYQGGLPVPYELASHEIGGKPSTARPFYGHADGYPFP